AKSRAPRWIAARSVHHGARTGADGLHMIRPRPISPMAHTTRPRAIVPMSILLMVAYASVRLSVDHVRERFVILVPSGLRWLDRVRRQASRSSALWPRRRVPATRKRGSPAPSPQEPRPTCPGPAY